MSENLLMSKLFQDLVSASSSLLGEDDVQKQFAYTLGQVFGIEKVIINNSFKNDGTNELYGYVANTKKTYIDNQLSEYSSFPQLINYKNRGFRSCALVPVILSGKVVSIVELLSANENKFTDDLLSSASLGAYFSGIALLYKVESERSLRLASYFNTAFNSNDPQFLVSHDGRIVKFNDKAHREWPEKKFNAVLIDEFLGMNFGQLSIIRSNNTKISIGKPGTMKVYRLLANSVNEKLLHLILQDVTEFEMMAKVVESMDAEAYAGALYLDLNMNVAGATDSITRLIGYDKNLIIGKNIIELTIERQRGELKEMLEKNEMNLKLHGAISLSTQSGVPTHLRFVMNKWANGTVMLFSDASAEGLAGSIRSAFVDFINSTSDVVVTMDDLGYIKDCNIPTESVLGYPKSVLIGRDMRSFYFDQATFEKSIAFVRGGGKIDNSYAVLLGREGNRIDATHSIRLFTGDESADYIIVIKELETKRELNVMKETIEKDEKDLKRMKATGDLKSQFIYNISHELKTPLTNIIGFSKLLYSGEFGPLNAEQLGYINTIIDEAGRFMFIIQQVLDAAKLESEKMKLETREVDMKELQNNPSILALKEFAEKNKKLKFSWEVGFDVPTVVADPNRLIQVFVNLIGNATKFTEKGEIKVKITKKDKNTIQCDVTDTGIGISDEDKHKLFKEFYEAPTKKGLVKQEGAGTGLGLSITRKIVNLHGGRLNCDSELGKGSTFWFTLKIKGPPKKKKDKE